MRSTVIASVFTLAIALVTPGALCQQPPGDQVGLRIEFLGKNLPDDWAYAASRLVDLNSVNLKTAPLALGQGPCETALRALKLWENGVACSKSIDDLIKRLNPNLPNAVPTGTPIVYPDVPVERMTWVAAFDKTLPTDVERLRRVTEEWRSNRSA